MIDRKQAGKDDFDGRPDGFMILFHLFLGTDEFGHLVSVDTLHASVEDRGPTLFELHQGGALDGVER